MNARSEPRAASPLPALAFALAVRLLLTFYWLTRFGGHLTESDAARTTLVIRSVFESGQLLPAGKPTYPYGYLYPAYVSALALLSGLDVLTWQQWLLPFAGLILTLLAFVLYLRLLGSPKWAACAVTLLNLQGDFLYTSQRGSHEKLDFMLIFLALAVIVLAALKTTSLRQRLALAAVYYLVILAENTEHVFFATTFTFTLLLAFLFWLAMRRRQQLQIMASPWVIYIALMSLLFSFLVIFYWYPPARAILYTSRDLLERVRLILFSAAEPPAELYSMVSANWVLPGAWLWLRVFDIFLFTTALIGWWRLVRLFFRRSEASDLSQASSHFWLLLLFPPFFLQNVAVVISDITGSVGEINNLQIRLIPLTAFVAAPLSAYAISHWAARLRQATARFATLRAIVVTLLSAVVLTLTLIKSVSEPLLANAWIFYTPAEEAGLAWLNQNIPYIEAEIGRRTPRVWAGPTFRLGDLWRQETWSTGDHRIPVFDRGQTTYTYVLLSPQVRLNTLRYHEALPNILNAQRIYVNGEVEIYYLPPEARP